MAKLKTIQTRSTHEKNKRETSHKTQPFVALVGYTNAGKSALTNLCTGSKLESENLLFQTLNTANRGFRLLNGQNAVMLDTVGFITDLPHGLVESFKATLDEIHFADVIIHVRDISHPHHVHQRETVLRVLEEIGVDISSRYMEVWNKIDLVEDREQVELDHLIQQEEHPTILMSCLTKEGHNELMSVVGDMTTESMGK